MKEKEYLPRIIDDILPNYLEAFGAVLIVGPKWCGKTTTATRFAKSSIKMQDVEKSNDYLKLAELAPKRLLAGEPPHLIDEWQMAPVLWDAVRNEVDARGEPGQFILTGSAVPKDEGMHHTGTGRFARIVMHPMSLFESKESNGNISLINLLNGNIDVNGIESQLDIESLVYAICRGGWPASMGISQQAALLIPQAYIDAVCESDVSRIQEELKNPTRIRAILRSYARNISTLATKTSIRKDVIANDVNISETTFFNYITALQRLYIIKDIEAWCPSIRSKTAIRSNTKKGFVDPSLAVAALGLSPDQLLNDMNTLGFMFESLCIRDLRIYSQKLGGEISYYHDRYGLECDAVIHMRDGRYILIEMKLGSFEIEEGASHLLKLSSLINENGLTPPSVCMVLTGGKYAYQREDGVYVIPIGCLRD